ncbi:MAG: metallophosphoesterase [Lachnospiraceae bacterium]|nr:metallophosphoesterase [Lachnospiraceae bacterium]
MPTVSTRPSLERSGFTKGTVDSVADIFEAEKYQTAAQKVLTFIQRQMNVNNYSLFPSMKEQYTDDYTGHIYGRVEMPADAVIRYPKYICCDQFYDEKFSGQCSGQHQNTGEARTHLGVEVTTYLDMKYRAAICFLHADGTWRTETYYKETDYYGTSRSEITKTVTYWYRSDAVVNANAKEGIKGFELKYYDWLDEDGTPLDLDNLPGTLVGGEDVEGAHFLYATTYTLRPQLRDDGVLDSALPYYADYSATLSILADVEYLVPGQQSGEVKILLDEPISIADLEPNPPVLPIEPEPWLRCPIVQPGPEAGTLAVTWTSNFPEDCVLTFDGSSQTIAGTAEASGYRTYRATVRAPLGGSYSYAIEGNGCRLSGEVSCPNTATFLLAGDPQLINEDDAANWYKVERIAQEAGAAQIIGLGDMTDSIVDIALQEKQYQMLAQEQTVPLATVRGNHDKDTHFLAHYSLPNYDGGDIADWWYTFGGVLFIALDTNSADCAYHIGFMERALASGNYDWIILLTHHSLYSTSQAGQTNHVKSLRDGLSDFILRSNIDLVVAGHEHFMCRTSQPGKLFFTASTCTGCKFGTADFQEAEWNELTIDVRVPMYTVMTVSPQKIVLDTYDLGGNQLDSVSVEKGVA